jgi:hypothetical protein
VSSWASICHRRFDALHRRLSPTCERRFPLYLHVFRSGHVACSSPKGGVNSPEGVTAAALRVLLKATSDSHKLRQIDGSDLGVSVQECQTCNEGWLDTNGHCTVCARGEGDRSRGKSGSASEPEQTRPGATRRQSQTERGSALDGQILSELREIKNAARTIRNFVVMSAVAAAIGFFFLVWVFLQ